MKNSARLLLLLASCLLPISATAQPQVQILDGRVTADENWVRNEAAMSVGLISDMMLVGIPNDGEAAASAGAVCAFRGQYT